MSDEMHASPTVPIPLQRPATAGDPSCRCGHPIGVHDHFRGGTDCSICGCARYRAVGRLADQLVAVLNRGL